jgi:orotidine-5'-phosphate decarboxylase
LEPRERLILALDTEDLQTADRLAGNLRGYVGGFKIGHKLLYRGGLELARDLCRLNKVFVDVKLHDIDSTVEQGIRDIAETGASMATVHGYPSSVAAALRGAEGSDLLVLAVTVLTSFNDRMLAAAGYAGSVQDTVELRAIQAEEDGRYGLVCSPADLTFVRECFSGIIVTPGVRLYGNSHEHQRFMTPLAAVAGGSDYLVVGREVIEAEDPVAVLTSYTASIAHYVPDFVELMGA